ncbi:Trans-acting regulatory protein HvrA [Methylococcales bacterium]|nr:Trans-acting regulatory protein HvrA [Methylococcales bacterium]
MTTNLHELSESELAAVIDNAQKALLARQEGKKKEGIAKIREIASSIGVTVEISSEPSKSSPRKGGKVAVKYQNPANPANKWTGRGMKPKWLRELIDQGHQLEEFVV